MWNGNCNTMKGIWVKDSLKLQKWQKERKKKKTIQTIVKHEFENKMWQW